jgi:hypothetical protein
MDGRPLAETVFSIPVHVSTVAQVSLAAGLINSLVVFREHASDHKWSRWQNAISCFNQANTDNDAIRYQVEWVLLCSAFEHILEARPQAEDVAQKFTDTAVPSTPLLARDAKRNSAQKKWNVKRPLRYEWMKEFYRIRGDFAHGKLKTQQTAVWSALEHIVLETIAFPLLVSCLLQKDGKYELTDGNQAQINAFERLADELFLERPANQKSSKDSIWSRLLEKAKSDLVKAKILEVLKAKGVCDRPSSR